MEYIDPDKQKEFNEQMMDAVFELREDIDRLTNLVMKVISSNMLKSLTMDELKKAIENSTVGKDDAQREK